MKLAFVQKLVLPLVISLMVTGCMDADPFGLSSRRIVGKYQLELFESGAYYITKDGHKWSGGGFVEGTVLQIGWNADVLAVKRYSTYRGDPDGWILIDLHSDKMSGPISEAEFLKRFPLLQIQDPESLWKVL